MSRKDISILVINKTVFEDEIHHYDLKAHIEILRICGYEVIEIQRARRLTPKYDIIVAHPLWSEISNLYDFHKEYPKIPIVFYSNLAMSSYYKDKKIKKSRIGGFLTDSDGCYYKFGGSTQDFLKLIKHLSSEIYRRRNF